MQFHVADDPMYSSVTELDKMSFTRTAATIVVPMQTVDDLLAKHCPAGQSVRLAKIDVEGAEVDVLKGCSATLSACRIEYLYIEIHRPQLATMSLTPEDVISLIEQHGYQLHERLHPRNLLFRAPRAFEGRRFIGKHLERSGKC